MAMRTPRWLRRATAFLRWDARDADMDKEMAFHVESLAREYVRGGMALAEAERAARRRFGDATRLKERGHDARSSAVVDGLVRDVRGKGLMLGIEFDTAEHAEEVQWACFERGLLVLECGKTSVRMSPALTVSEAEMETALRIFGEAVTNVAGHAPQVLAQVVDAGALHEVEAAG